MSRRRAIEPDLDAGRVQVEVEIEDRVDPGGPRRGAERAHLGMGGRAQGTHEARMPVRSLRQLAADACVVGEATLQVLRAGCRIGHRAAVRDAHAQRPGPQSTNAQAPGLPTSQAATRRGPNSPVSRQ